MFDYGRIFTPLLAGLAVLLTPLAAQAQEPYAGRPRPSL